MEREVKPVGRDIDGRVEPFEGKAGNADSPDLGAGCSSVHLVCVSSNLNLSRPARSGALRSWSNYRVSYLGRAQSSQPGSWPRSSLNASSLSLLIAKATSMFLGMGFGFSNTFSTMQKTDHFALLLFLRPVGFAAFELALDDAVADDPHAGRVEHHDVARLHLRPQRPSFLAHASDAPLQGNNPVLEHTAQSPVAGH